MLIIGERINSTRKSINELIRARDASALLREVEKQLDAGAHFIDINCAMTHGDEIQDIDWAINVIQNKIDDFSISIDSPNYLAIDRALKVYKAKGSVMINSITAEDDRISTIVPLAVKYDAGLIALTMDGKGMPDNAVQRRDIARTIMTKVTGMGLKAEKIYFDPLIRPISTEPAQAVEFLSAIAMIKALGPVKTVCGLSNVSFGLPARSRINASFLAMAAYAGLDAAILDPTDVNMYASIKASAAIMGRDEYCASYIKAFREKKL